MEKKRFNWVMLPEGAVIVTKKEREALNAHQEKMRTESIEAIFTDVEELLMTSMKVEKKIQRSTDSLSQVALHRYGELLCETLLSDLQKIKRKHIEREEE